MAVGLVPRGEEEEEALGCRGVQEPLTGPELKPRRRVGKVSPSHRESREAVPLFVHGTSNAMAEGSKQVLLVVVVRKRRGKKFLLFVGGSSLAVQTGTWEGDEERPWGGIRSLLEERLGRLRLLPLVVGTFGTGEG